MKRRTIAIAGAILGLTLALTGCVGTSGPAGSETTPNSGNLGYVTTGVVKLPDGREVLCVSNKRGYAGGLSCDWAHANQGGE